jgi:hypothetical protein
VVEGLTEGEIAELARVFGASLAAHQLLEAAGLSRGRMPTVSGNAENFWQEVSWGFTSGIIDFGRWRVLVRALEQYPGNRIFKAGVAVAHRPAGGGAGRTAPGDFGGDHAAGPAGSGGDERAGHGEALPFTIVALDARRYSKQVMPTQLDWRVAIRYVVSSSVRRSGIDPHAVTTQDSGDGVLVGFGPQIPKRLVVAEFVRRVGDEVDAYNRGRVDDVRLRLRVSVHCDETVVHDNGFAGDAAVVAARLIDAQPTRAVLEAMDEVNLAVILSDEFYRATVRHRLLGLNPRDYRKVTVVVSKYRGWGWLHVPGYPISSVPPTPPDPSDPAGPAGSSGSGPGAEPGGPAGGSDAGPEPGAETGGPQAPPPPADPPPGRGRAGRGGGSDGKWDFLVSYAPYDKDREWAEWIAWKLEAQGRRVYLQAWDGVAGSNTVKHIDAAVTGSSRTIVVLTSKYIETGRHQANWYAAWDQDPQGAARRLIPVRVEDFEAPGLLHGIVPVDLFGLDDDEAQARLVQKIDQAIEGRAKPATVPRFPGGRVPSRARR